MSSPEAKKTLAATASQQGAALVPKINALLAEHGVQATVSQLHLAAVPDAAAPAEQARCYWNDEGVFVCE
jgi:hypothetical protein